MTNQSSALREPEREREQDHLRPPTSSPQHLMPGIIILFFRLLNTQQFSIHNSDSISLFILDATTTTTTTSTNSSSKRLRCSPSPPRHHQQQQQSPLLQIRRISPNSERHQRSGESPPVSLYPRKINRERERDYNSETGTEEQSQPLRLKRKAHPDNKKHSDYTSSLDGRRSRTPDEDIDDMDDEDDAMSNENGIMHHLI